MTSVIKQLVPKPIRPVLGRAWQELQHKRQRRDRGYMQKLFGSHVDLVPPTSLMFDGPVGYEVFKENGEEFLGHYIELAGLNPHERMLDVGSGVGRKTLPLVSYLNQQGSYEGIDIVPQGVSWCAEKYTPQFPNFRFQLIDVYNHLYNPQGKSKAKDYRFPFADREFDFVIMNSVFTHMLADDVENYLSEVARVLKNDGRCLISFFLLNDESLQLIAAGSSTLDLQHDFGPAKAISREMPEDAIGFDEGYVTDLYARCKLQINQPIRYGSWCGRQTYLSYQDLVLATRHPTD
ncbi:MAG TPA: class I SAM-dependent methyltransferase [Pyrinomonadaceae bacterium]|nr:class I SAM-dependent methyltransferase [Pyrinomonadaceae bacterium]